MRSIILAQVVSSIFIGTVVASPTAPSLDSVDRRCLDFARGCDPHNVLHQESTCDDPEKCNRVQIHYDKRCYGEHCSDGKCAEGKTCEYRPEPKILPPPNFHVHHEKEHQHTEPHHEKECDSKDGCKEEKECDSKDGCKEEKECESKECHHEKESCKSEKKCYGKKCKHSDKCQEKSHEKPHEKSHGEIEAEYRGYKCGAKYYPASQLQKAASSGCELLKKNKQLKFTKYPMSYSPGAGEEVEWPAHGVQPAGSYYVYPIQDKAKPYMFGHYGPHMVLLTKDCEFAGAVVENKTSVCPKQKWCFKKLFNKPDVYYTTCHVDYNHRHHQH